MLFTFDSVEEFAKQAAPLSDDGASSWYGNISYKDAVRFAIEGDEKYVKQAEELINKLDLEMPETRAYQTIRSPFGGRANFGDWVVGVPDPMRRKVKRVSDVAPLKIVVSTTSSAGVDHKTMERRGATILALL